MPVDLSQQRRGSVGEREAEGPCRRFVGGEICSRRGMSPVLRSGPVAAATDVLAVAVLQRSFCLLVLGFRRVRSPARLLCGVVGALFWDGGHGDWRVERWLGFGLDCADLTFLADTGSFNNTEKGHPSTMPSARGKGEASESGSMRSELLVQSKASQAVMNSNNGRENSEMKYEWGIRSELLLQSRASQTVMNSNNGR
ncbi:hypothetical protein EJB05_31629, partial [Eragrostis curvula]